MIVLFFRTIPRLSKKRTVEGYDTSFKIATSDTGHDIQPESGAREVAEQLAEHHFWFSVQPEFGACCVAQQFEKLDFWSTFQAEFGERQVAQQFAVADVP